MAWISQLLKKTEAHTEDEKKVLEAPPPAMPRIDAPQLAVLAPDIGGISAFRLKFFDDTATAELYIDELEAETRRGTHTFWALQDEPDVAADAHKEALVLIRANLTTNIVYVVSFVDLESAWSFARFETKRGLDPSHFLIYWAAFAQVREEFDTISVVPAIPPRTLNQGVTTAEREPTRTIEQYIETQAPEAAVIGTPTDAERDSRAAAEAERRAHEASDAAEQAQKLADLAEQAEIEAAERAEASRIAEEERLAAEERARAVLEAKRQAEQDRLLAEAEAIRIAEEERLAMRAEAARLAEEARREAEIAAQREAEAVRLAAEAEAARIAEEERQEAEAQARAQADADRIAFAEAQAEAVISGEAGVLTPPEPVTTSPGDEEAEDVDPEDETLPAATGVVFTHTAAPAIEDTATIEIPQTSRKKKRKNSDDPAAQFPEEPSLSDFDIAWEVERLLKNRRWEKREEPFNGFRSPPGKF